MMVKELKEGGAKKYENIFFFGREVSYSQNFGFFGEALGT